MAHLGIDLGTSNTLVALVKNGAPTIVDIDGNKRVPSVIYLREPGGLSEVGLTALDTWAEPDADPELTFRRWKLDIGEAVPPRVIRPGGPQGDELLVTPEFLTTQLVEWVVKKITTGLGGEVVESVLVTVPHGWRRAAPEKCQATKKAAAEARVGGKPITVQGLTVSEPVAAAAYWIWEYQLGGGAPLEGECILVCDVGGGTFDLSLVRAGREGEPHVVVDAENSNFAGDYADALICARVCEQFNAQHGTENPTDAEIILSEIASPSTRFPWLRQWFRTSQVLKEKLSRAAQSPSRAGRVASYSELFSDTQNRVMSYKLGLDELTECLAPFYERGRHLLTAFLQQAGDEPHAAVFCGGGSQIVGVQSRIVQPVLQSLYPAEAEAILGCIPPNSSKIDQAIALGAALIANGLVLVEERLLKDIGIVVQLDPQHPVLPDALGLPREEPRFLLTPLLARGAVLPTFRSSEELAKMGIHSTHDPNEAVHIEVVIDDHGDETWALPFELLHPSARSSAQREFETVNWEIHVDAEGVLTVTVKSARGLGESKAGNTERPAKKGTPYIVVGPRAPNGECKWPRVTPARLQETIRELGRKEGIKL